MSDARICNALNRGRTHACELATGHDGMHREGSWAGGYHWWVENSRKPATAAAKTGDPTLEGTPA